MSADNFFGRGFESPHLHHTRTPTSLARGGRFAYSGVGAVCNRMRLQAAPPRIRIYGYPFMKLARAGCTPALPGGVDQEHFNAGAIARLAQEVALNERAPDVP